MSMVLLNTHSISVWNKNLTTLNIYHTQIESFSTRPISIEGPPDSGISISSDTIIGNSDSDLNLQSQTVSVNVYDSCNYVLYDSIRFLYSIGFWWTKTKARTCVSRVAGNGTHLCGWNGINFESKYQKNAKCVKRTVWLENSNVQLAALPFGDFSL